MSTPAPSATSVLDAVDDIGPAGTPVTASEVAERFDCTDRTVHDRLDALVEDGPLETKDVGARGRVWWRPAAGGRSGPPAGSQTTGSNGRPLHATDEDGVHPVVDSGMVGVVVWDGDFRIRDANDAFLEMTGLEYDEAVGTSWRELTPEEFYPASERHIEEVEATGSGVPYEKQYYHADGSRWWGLSESRTVDDDETVEFVVDVTERKEAEEELRESEERLDAFVRATSDVVYRMSPDWSEMHSLDGQACVADADEPRRTWLEEFIPPDARAGFEEAVERAVGGERTLELEHRVVKVDGTEGWMHFRAVPILDDDGDVVEWFGTATDVTERKEATAALERLTDASRELMDADAGTIADRAAELVRQVLDVEYATLWRYDGTTGELEEQASHAAEGLDPDAVGCPEGLSDAVWRTFVGDEVDVADDLDGASAGEPLRSRVLVPLGRHGVVCAGSTRSGAFDERVVDLAKTVAATVETAWDRAEGERELADRNEELERLDGLNRLIRNVDQALVEADTVSAIDEAVCEQLAAADRFEFAWVGDYDATADAVEPRAWAGVDSAYLEAWTTAAGDSSTEDPAVEAARTRDVQVVSDVATDARVAEVRERTLERGARSVVGIPLAYDESLYGVLTVAAGRPRPDERDHEVLAEFGRTVAHAVDAVERRETRGTGSVVEVTVRSAGADGALCRLSRESGATVEVEGVVPGADGEATVFLTATGVGTDAFVAAAGESLGVADPACLVEREAGALYKARLSDPTLASAVVDAGGRMRTLAVDAGTATAVVDIPRTADVRTFVEGVRRVAPDLELLSRRTRTRSVETEGTLRTAFEERLTARQREVLELAYRSGYFESPRVTTGAELSEVLDVSQSTFTYHLRGAERELCELVFDSS